MKASSKTYWSVGFLLLTVLTASSVLTASVRGSFRQLDVDFSSVDPEWSSSAVHTPALSAPTERFDAKSGSAPCTRPKTTVTLQPTRSTVHDTFTSTKVRVVKRAVVSTKTEFEATATATLMETVTVSASPTAKAPSATPTVSPGGLSALFAEESNEVNSTSSVDETADKKTMVGRLTNIVRRVVTLGMGILLTPIVAVTEHLTPKN